MYKTFVRPVLEYASPCWNPYLNKDIHLIESVQRRFTKRIPEIERLNLTYTERLESLDLERLDLRRLKTDFIWVFKIMYGHVDLNPNDLFTFHPHAYEDYAGVRISDAQLRLQQPRFNKLCRKNFFSNRITSPWNDLPTEIKKSKSVKAFKKYLDDVTTDPVTFNLFSYLRPLLL